MLSSPTVLTIEMLAETTTESHGVPENCGCYLPIGVTINHVEAAFARWQGCWRSCRKIKPV